MALGKTVDPGIGVDATYHRIDSFTYDRRRGEIVAFMSAYKDKTAADDKDVSPIFQKKIKFPFAGSGLDFTGAQDVFGLVYTYLKENEADYSGATDV